MRVGQEEDFARLNQHSSKSVQSSADLWVFESSVPTAKAAAINRGDETANHANEVLLSALDTCPCLKFPYTTFAICSCCAVGTDSAGPEDS